MHALKVADNLDLLMGNLKSNLHKVIITWSFKRVSLDWIW
jgi:hypothetical protein